MVARSIVRLREVVYTLSPSEHDIMGGMFKDIPHKVNKYWNLWGRDAVVFGVIPYIATVETANYLVHQEELSHRY
jgi:Cytochrome b-c1 complex subunit 8